MNHSTESNLFGEATGSEVSRRAFLQQGTWLTLGGLAGTSLHAADEKQKPEARTGLVVRTVLGPVEPKKLGVTLTHEHAPVVDWSELYEMPIGPIDPIRDEMLTRTAGLLEAFHKSLPEGSGPGAVVECTPIRVGRYPQLLVELARKTPVHIIACTGFWCEAMAPQHPWAARLSLEKNGAKEMAKLYIREINEGMEDPLGSWGERFTKVKVGIIKVATSKFLRPTERRCHEAAAIANRETGCPITTHTTDGGGLEEAQLFLKLGVKPEKIVIGHQGNQDDREHDDAHEYHRQLTALGVYVQFDRVGHANYTVEKTAKQILKLVEAGFVKQVLLSHDHVPYFYTDYTMAEKKPTGWKAEKPDYTVVTTGLVAALTEAGVSKVDIQTMLVENPQRMLAF